MKTEKLIALKPFPYDGVALKAGDPFMASYSHADILIKLRQAERDETPAEPVTEAAKPSPVVIEQPKAEPTPTQQVAAAPPWAPKKGSKKTSE